MQKFNLILACTFALLLTAPLAFAGNADQEIATAAAHAQMAAAATDKTTADMHLHHVINCLVGSADNRFDVKAGNPCNGMGNGAIHDLGHAPAEHIRLQRALMYSERALHDKNLDGTKQAAKRAAEVLKQASGSK